jgi:hypothetical protein
MGNGLGPWAGLLPLALGIQEEEELKKQTFFFSVTVIWAWQYVV